METFDMYTFAILSRLSVTDSAGLDAIYKASGCHGKAIFGKKMGELEKSGLVESFCGEYYLTLSGRKAAREAAYAEAMEETLEWRD